MTNSGIPSDVSNEVNLSLAPDEIVLIMGGPGSGKGTTGEILARQLGAELRSTGQMIRSENDPGLMAILSRGDLAPEAEIERVLTLAIRGLAGKPLILDGATKKPREAAWLLKNLAKFGRHLTVVIYLDVNEDLARRRIVEADRGRHDDKQEFQDHRWHEFHSETLQSIDIYRRAGLLETIVADAPAEELARQMLAILARRQQTNENFLSEGNVDNLRVIDRLIAATVIISADNKILMGRKDPSKGGVYADSWHIPGGGLDQGESLEAAARRECQEEVGLDTSELTFTRVPFIGHGQSPKLLSTGEKVWCRISFNRFEVKLNQLAADISVKPSEDLVELRWFDEADLASVKQIPGGREFFIQAGYIKQLPVS